MKLRNEFKIKLKFRKFRKLSFKMKFRNEMDTENAVVVSSLYFEFIIPSIKW